MKKVLFCALFFLPFAISAQLKINEIMSNNVSAVMDDAYNYSMWVELYNPSTTTSYNQSAYYFTDDLTQPRKWAPASKLIAANGYSVLWFERSERTGHATIKLDPEGGKLYLLNATAQIVDSVTYPAQYRNVSYGRKTDGAAEWTYFEQYSAGTTNTGKSFAIERCGDPVFTVPGGFYSSAINVKFVTPMDGDTIYYTLNSSEPSRANGTRYVPGYVVSLTSTAVVRAKCISAKKLSGNVISSTYFLNERNFKLPVVSIVTTQANLTDNTIGIYVQGTNGLTGNGMTTAANWNQDWDRPVNVELFDTTKTSRLNQEVDINIAGGWTRMNGQKSLKINPKKKFGSNKLDYDFFPKSKPGMKYKSILLRNSGNDFAYSMMRDAFMNSLVAGRMNIDCIAYEPAVCFMNGVYYGIQNLRERSDVDYIYSNYGYDEDEIRLVESGEMATDTSFLKLTAYVSANDITSPAVYANVCSMMDIDSYMNYYMSQIYYANTDWPDNNIKAWKKKVNGKWRWILYDTDFGYSLYDTSLYNHSSLLYALGELTSDVPPAWSTLLLKKLVLNETFRNHFIDRFCIHISSTFETTRANHIMDSIAAKITTEIAYHKTKWGSNRTFAADISNMKNFSANRPNIMLSYISSRFLSAASSQTMQITSNNPRATYKFNAEPVNDASINLKSFYGRTVALEANPIPAFKFKQWELTKITGTNTIMPNSTLWKYYDGSTIPAANWNTTAYSDAAWKTGTAPLGYGLTGVVTTIGYGGVSSNKYPTAYFRKTLSIANLSTTTNYILTAFVDDGAAIYINGVEIGRYNMPTGALGFSSLATSSNNGVSFSYAIPQNILKEGDNIIAVEVHQNTVSSTDLIFNMQITCDVATIEATTNPVYNTTLSSNLKLRAVYEQVNQTDPDTNLNVRINEIVSSNNQIADENGEYDDYIELYNNGTSAVNIAGWYLTDTPSNRTLAQIPATDTLKTRIPAKGRIMLWADSQPTQGPLHVGFKLSQSGEAVVLSKVNYLGNVTKLDSVSFSYMAANLSLARVPDGSDNWLIQAPTPYAINDNASDVPALKVTPAVYPTLVRDFIRVNNAANLSIRVIDLTGKVLVQQTCPSDVEKISLTQLQRGVYIISVGNQNFKIVKL